MKKKSLNGKKGELEAAEYLIANHKYKILERNFRRGKEEIDIIAEDNGTIVFIEVKTRKDAKYEYPASSISQKKIEKIKRVAEFFLYQNGIYNVECRFDAVLILKNENKITLIKDAFR
jgi:putative endonuclease